MLKLVRALRPLVVPRGGRWVCGVPLTRLSEEDQSFRDAAQRFAREEVGPRVSKMDEEEMVDPEVLTGLFEQGFMGVEIPEEYGGSGGTFTQACLVVEEVARVDPAVAVSVDIHNTLINKSVMEFGTETQKQSYLPRLASDCLGSFCISESDAGSDAFSLACKASKVSGGWSITGTKQWISNSNEAGVFLVFATEDMKKKHKGIIAFLVDAETPGLTIGTKVSKLGIRASSTHEVVLDNVFVSDDNVLGNIGEGYKVAIQTLNEGRIGIAAQMLGLAQGAYDYILPYVHTRNQFGGPLTEFQAIKHQIAELAVDIECCRLMVYNACAMREAGMDINREAAMCKLFASRVAERVASKSIELMGGNGFSREYPLEKLYRDAKIGSIYEGTSNIMLETIFKDISKKYKLLN